MEAVECMPLSTAEETVSADDGREGLEVASNDVVPAPADTGPKAAAHPASLALYSSSAVPSSTSLPRQHAPPQPSHPATHDPCSCRASLQSVDACTATPVSRFPSRFTPVPEPPTRELPSAPSAATTPGPRAVC